METKKRTFLVSLELHAICAVKMVEWTLGFFYICNMQKPGRKIIISRNEMEKPKWWKNWRRKSLEPHVLCMRALNVRLEPFAKNNRTIARIFLWSKMKPGRKKEKSETPHNGIVASSKHSVNQLPINIHFMQCLTVSSFSLLLFTFTPLRSLLLFGCLFI